MSKKKGTCRYFTGVQNEVCDAGIRYDDLAKPGIPCIVKYRRSDCVACERYEDPSDDDVAEWNAFIEQRMEMHRKVGPVIVEIKRQHKGHSWSGVIECPCCGGKLHVSHAAYNGHVHGQCETDECLSWME